MSMSTPMEGPAAHQCSPVAGMRQPPGPVTRTGAWFLIHAVHLLSSLLGDDWLGRQIRRGVLRMAGARIASGANLHGGTYISAPWRLTMGRGAFMNRGCYLDLGAPIVMGERVSIGNGCTFVTTDHPIGPSAARCGPCAPRPIEVGAGAWLGANVTVLPGVRIGSGAVVAAGSLVTRDVLPDTMVGGNPARRLRTLDESPDSESVAG